ncbi:MAG TPA: hypothetical protein VFI42_11615, partial [Thermomicrobiaceae bacterium]|nr:hypothetical protein [Thermomicrobiaceae bacterium]
MTAMEPTATRIPVPADFPIAWEQPGDENLFFTMDRMHWPSVITSLDDSVIKILIHTGWWRAAEAFAMPMRLHARRINGYHYGAMVPLPLPPPELAALAERSAERLQTAAGSLGRDWHESYLPEIKRLIAETAGADFRARRLPELARDLDDAIARAGRETEIHFRIAFPMIVAQSLFDEFYRDIFAEPDALNALRLLQGLDNLTVRLGRDLWQLSRDARRSPEVLQVIQQAEPGAVAGMLQQSEAGRRFMRQLHGWLEIYGHRGDGLGISSTSWIEDPTPVVLMLREYVARTDYDPNAEQARLAAAREEAIAAARARLAGYPEAVVGQFEALLTAAQDATVISEDHDYWIDFRGLHELRRVVVAIGARLAEAGSLADQNEVVYLTLAEAGVAARDPQGRDWSALVSRRAAELAHFATLTPPPAIGTPPPGPPPDDPLVRGMGKFFGWHQPEAPEPGLLKGVGGSKGTATGTVKVIHTLDEAHKLQPGDILV